MATDSAGGPAAMANALREEICNIKTPCDVYLQQNVISMNRT